MAERTLGEGTTERTGIRQRLERIGPALVLAAVVVGPGSIALSTIAGSLYGYELLWVPVVATVFMIVYVRMAARIGLVKRRSSKRHARNTARESRSSAGCSAF